MGNGDDLQGAAREVLTTARGIIATAGENHQSMHEIGRLLTDFARSGAVGDRAPLHRPGEIRVDHLLARDTDGSKLMVYGLDGWQSPPRADAHWHNYWQSLLMVSGTWADTVWRPVGEVSNGVAEIVEVDRREVFTAGELQVLGPDEPHGWEADEARRADGVVMLLWVGSARGKPRVVLDPATGALTEAYDELLNPAP